MPRVYCDDHCSSDGDCKTTAISIKNGSCSEALSLDSITKRLRIFARRRDWYQYHTPKNLILALTGEVGELAALYRWESSDSAVRLDGAEDEIADIAIFLIRLADVIGVDILSAIDAKIAKNEINYPVKESRGSAAKRKAGIAIDTANNADIG